RRHRNFEWAKSAVRESASISAEKALELKVVDLIATDLPDLLKQLNGRAIDGKTLKTVGAEISEIKMSPSERVFQKLWRPEVMFILMLIAMYGIIGELTTPGAILPGVVGAIALILALYLAAILPVKAGAETMVGKTVTALTPIDSRGGRIFVEGEYWNAVSDTPIGEGDVAEIAAVRGLTLRVQPAKGA